jgi:hypothetical protein
LKLQCDALLSTSAFKLILRRYSVGQRNLFTMLAGRLTCVEPVVNSTEQACNATTSRWAAAIETR